MSRAVDVALISIFLLLLFAWLLAIPPALGVPACIAAGIANSLSLIRE